MEAHKHWLVQLFLEQNKQLFYSKIFLFKNFVEIKLQY